MRRNIDQGWVSLIDLYGKDFIDSFDFSTKNCENLCLKMFSDIRKPESFDSNRGDFIVDGTKYYDQKKCKVKHYLPTNKSGVFYHITYSNILSKLWINFAMDELKLIYEDYLREYYDDKWNREILFKLKTIYYKKEMTFNDICFIDDYALSCKNPTSFCGRNNISFLYFLNCLCRHNVKRFSNLILFHEPINREQMYKIDSFENGSFNTYKYPKNYIVTPINIKKTNVYVDYIGYNGFKCYIEQKDDDTLMYIDDEMIPYIKELDDAINTLLKVNTFKHDRKISKKFGFVSIELNNEIELFEEKNIDFLYKKPIHNIAA